MFNKMTTAFVFSMILILLVFSGCTKEKTEEIDVEVKGFKEIQVTGYGYARIPENASPNVKILARQRASMRAAANLVAQISGVEFSFKKKKGEPAAFKMFETSSQEVIRGANTDYYDLWNNMILARQTIVTKIPVSGVDDAVFYETSFRTDNLQKALIREYRNAVQKMASTKYKNKKEITGKILLSDMIISDYKGKGDIKVKAKIFVVFNY